MTMRTEPPVPVPVHHRPIKVTRHAQQRAIERLGLSKRQAPMRLKDLYHCSIKLPDRYGRRLNGLPPLRRRYKHAARYRVCGSVLLICHGRTIITAWRLALKQEAIVCWWAVSGQ